MRIVSNFLKGVYWTNLANIISVVAKFGGGIYLARKIDPAIFGQQALIVSYLSVLWAIGTDFGQVSAIMRQKNDMESYISMQLAFRVYTVLIICPLLIAILALGLLPLSEDMVKPFIVLFLVQCLGMVTSVYSVYMQKLMLFRTIALIRIVSIVGAVVVAVFLANKGYGLWALIWLIGAEQLISAILTFLYVPKRVVPVMNRELVKGFIQFGKYVYMGSLAKRIGAQLDKVVLGNIVGSSQLGFYTRGHSVGGLFQQLVTAPLLTVFGPIVGEIRGQRQKLHDFFYTVMKMILLATLGCFALLALVLPEFIELIYGTKWLPVVPIFWALIPFLVLKTLEAFVLNFHLIEGDSKLFFFYHVLSFIVLIASVFPLMEWHGTVGVAMAADVSASISFVYILVELKKRMDISLTAMTTSPLTATILTTVIVLEASHYLHCSKLEALVAKSFLFGFAFVTIVLIIDKSFCRSVWGYMRHRSVASA